MKLLFVIIAAVCIAQAFGAASNSLSDCLNFAANFNNTCPSSNTAYSSVTAGSGLQVFCPRSGPACQTGTASGNQCVFEHKLCVTCATANNVTRIRVQTNSLPNRCVLGVVTAQNIDFTVNYNPDVSYTPTYIRNTATSSTELSTLLCNLQTVTSGKPSWSNFVNNGANVLSVLTAIGADGGMIFKNPSADNADPFYPPPPLVAPPTDICLTHTSDYHYHSPSSCQVIPPVGAVGLCSTGCSTDFKSWMTTYGWTNADKVKRVMGIALDGHPVYSPWDSLGNKITGGYDACNGMFLDAMGNYGYVLVDTFPYVPNCFGPSNYPCATPTCTTNPALNFTRSSFMAAGSCDGTGNSAATVSSLAAIGIAGAVALAMLLL